MGSTAEPNAGQRRGHAALATAIISIVGLAPSTWAAPICTFDFESTPDPCGAWQSGGTQNEWQNGVPAGGGGGSNGCSGQTTNPNPTAAASGSRVWGTDLGLTGWTGTQYRYEANGDQTLTSPVLDLRRWSGVTFSFRRWLNVEAGWDFAYLEVDNGDGIWRQVWSSSGGSYADTAWVPMTFDVSSLVDGKSAVRFRFRLQSDVTCNYTGLSVDLVEIAGTDQPPRPPADVWVEDVPRDAGGALSVRWLRSKDDGEGVNDVVRYEVWRATAEGGPYAKQADVAPGTHRWTDTGATTGTTFFYKVRAVDASGGFSDSPTSAGAASRSNAGEPEPPMMLSPAGCAGVSSGRPSFTWQNGEDDSATVGVMVEISQSPGMQRTVFTEGFETTDYKSPATVASWDTAAGEVRMYAGLLDQAQAGDARCLYSSSATHYAQIFVPSVSGPLYAVYLRAARVTAGTSGDYEVQIRNSVSGQPGTTILGRATVTVTDSRIDRLWVIPEMPTLSAGTAYAIVITGVNGASAAALAVCGQENNPYGAGKTWLSTNNGGSWSEIGYQPGGPPTWTPFDFRFFTYRWDSTQLVESLPVSTTLGTIAQVKLEADATLSGGTSISYHVRASSSAAWQPITPGAWTTLATPGTQLQWRANLSSTSASITPVLRSVTLYYPQTLTVESRLTSTGFAPAPPFFAGDGNGAWRPASALPNGTYYWRASHWDAALGRYGVPSESGCFVIGDDERIWIEGVGARFETSVGDQYIELYNVTAEDLPLAGLEICDPGSDGTCVALPSGDVVPAGGFYTIGGNLADFQAAYGFAPKIAVNPTRCTTNGCFNLSATGDEVVLRQTGAATSMDAFVWGSYSGAALPEGTWSGSAGTSITTGTCRALRRAIITVAGNGGEKDGPDADLSEENDEDLGTTTANRLKLFPVGALTLASSKPSLRTDISDAATITADAPNNGCGGSVVPEGTWFHATTTLGRLDAVDDHPIAPGIQIKVTGGKLSVVLRSGKRSGTARVTFTSLRGNSTGFIDIPFLGSADHLVATPAAQSVSAGGAAVVTIRVVDASHNPVAGAVPVTVTVSGGATISATTLSGATGVGTQVVSGTTGADGSATVTVTGTVAQTVNVTPDASSLPRTVANVAAQVTFTPGPAASFLVTGLPATVLAGSAHSITLDARDAYGNRATGYTGSVSFTSNDTAATLPGVTTFAAADLGLKTVPGVVLRTAGNRYVRAADTVTPSVAGQHADVLVVSSGASSLRVYGHPSPSTAGTTHTVTIAAVDATGNTDTSYSGAVTLSSDDPYPAELQLGVMLVNGIATATVRLKTAGIRSVTAQSGSLTGSQTGISVVAATAQSLWVSGIPSPVTAGASSIVQVQAVDAFGNAATASGALTFSSDDPAAALPTGLSLAGGTASGTVILKTAGTRQVNAQADALAGSQTGISVVAGPAASLRLSLFGPSVTAGTSMYGDVEALDAYGNRASTSGPLSWSASDPQASLPLPGEVSLANGVAVGAGPVVLRTAGTQTLTASVGSVSGSATITVNPAAAASLKVTGFPSPITAGTAGTMRVQAQDPFGNDTTASGALTFAASDPLADLPAPGTLSLSGGLLASAGPITLKTAGAGHWIEARTGSLWGRQESIAVQPAAAQSFTVSGMPSSFPAGSPQTLTVEARDAYGNRATGYAGTVRFTTSDPSPSVILPPNTSFSGANGIRTFSGGVTLWTAGTQWVEAIDTSNATLKGRHPDVTVLPGGNVRFVVDGVSDPAVAGAPQSVRVRAYDEGNNLVTNYRGTVAITTSDPLAVLPAQHTFTDADSGAFTFTGLVLKTVGTHVVTASEVGDPATFGTQSSVDVLAGPAASLRVWGIQSPVRAGIAVAALVQALDSYGNDAQASGPMTVTASDPAATVPAPGATSLSGGIGTTGLITFKTAGTWKVTVVAAGLTGEQTGIQVTAGAPTRLWVSGFPDPADAGSAGWIQVEAQDEFGNRATEVSGPVTFSSSDPAASLPASGAIAMSAGLVASAGPITLRTAGTQSITASASGLSGSQTGIDVRAGPATRLTLSGYPSPTTACTPATARVEALDAYGNRATGSNAPLSWSATDPGATLPADGVVSLSAGLAAAAGPVAFRGTGTFSLTVSSAGLVSGTQSGIQVFAGTAARLALTAPAQVDAGSEFSVSIAAYDACDNLAAGFSATLTFTSTDSTDVVTASISGGSGAASGFRFRTSGVQTLSAVGGGLFGQTTITVRPGPATTLELVASPTTVVAGSGVTATVTARDAYGNVALGYQGALAFVVTDPTGEAQSDVLVVPSVHQGVIEVPLAATFYTAGIWSLTVQDTSNPAIFPARVDGLTVVAAAAASIQVAGFPSVVKAGESTDVVVTVRDAYGNLAQGYLGTVVLTSSDPYVPTLRLSRTFDTFDAGVHVFRGVSLKTAGTQALFAEDTDLGLRGEQRPITVVPAASDHVELTADDGVAVAGTQEEIRIRILDRFNNETTDSVAVTVRAEKSAVIATSTMTGGATGGVVTTGTVRNGQASVTITDQVAETVTVRPSAALPQLRPHVSATVQFVPAPPDHVVARAQDGLAPPGGTELITLFVADRFGNATPGTFAVSASVSGAATIESTTLEGATPGGQTVTGTTGADGTATLVIKDTVAEKVRVDPSSAMLSGAPVPALVDFIASEVDHVRASPPATPPLAGTLARVTVQIVDVFGNAVGRAYGLVASVSGPATLVASSLGAPSGQTVTGRTAADGSAWLDIRSTVAGPVTVCAHEDPAVDDGAPGQPDLPTVVADECATVVFQPAAPARAALEGDSEVVAGEILSVLVRVVDIYGNTAPAARSVRAWVNGEARFEMTTLDGASAPAAMLSGTTAPSGTASVDLVDERAETVQVCAALDARTEADHCLQVTVVPAAPDHVAAAPAAEAETEALACGCLDVRVWVEDRFGNRVPGGHADVTITPGASARITATTLEGAAGLPAASAQGAIPAAGEAIVTVCDDQPDALAVTGSAPDLSGAPVPALITFRVGPVDPARSSLSVTTARLVAGAGAAQAVVHPRDGCGLLLGPGHQVEVAAGAPLVASAPAFRPGDGAYVADVDAAACPVPGEPASVVSATVDGVPLTGSAEIQVVCEPVAPGTSSVAVSRGTAEACAARDAAIIEVVPIDVGGRPLFGEFSITVDADPPRVIPGEAENLGGGRWRVPIMSNRCAGPRQLTVRVDGVPLVTRPTVEFICPQVDGAASRLTLEPALARTGDEVLAKVEGVDDCGNPAVHASVSMQILPALGTFGPPSGRTSGDESPTPGRFQSTLRLSRRGSALVIATVGGKDLTAPIEVFLPPDALVVELSANQETAVVGDLIAFTARVRSRAVEPLTGMALSLAMEGLETVGDAWVAGQKAPLTGTVFRLTAPVPEQAADGQPGAPLEVRFAARVTPEAGVAGRARLTARAVDETGEAVSAPATEAFPVGGVALRGGCGCSAGGEPAVLWLALLALVALRRRRAA